MTTVSWTDPNWYRNDGKFHHLLNILDSILKSRNVTLPTKLWFLFFQQSCTDVRIDHKEGWVPKNWCFQIVMLEKTLESPLDCKEIQPVHPKGDQSCSLEEFIGMSVHWKEWCWSWNSNTLATWCEELTRLKRPWCWERLKAGGEGDNRGWDGWMALSIQWIWVKAYSGR